MTLAPGPLSQLCDFLSQSELLLLLLLPMSLEKELDVQPVNQTVQMMFLRRERKKKNLKFKMLLLHFLCLGSRLCKGPPCMI